MPFRAFISVDVGDRLDWRTFRRELADVDRGIRPVKPEQVHMTLRFLGDIDEGLVEPIQAVMASAVDGVEPFTVTFQRVGTFPDPRRPRVVWIGLEGAEALGGITEALEEGVVGLGLKPERRGFRPHITVARVRSLHRRKRFTSLLDRWADRRFGTMDVREVRLMKSVLTPEGPIYTTVLTTALGE